MEFAAEAHNNAKRVMLSGQFTFADNQKFRQVMELVGEGVKSIELNFSGVDFIDSAGLGMLLLFRDECRKRHVDIALSSARGQVEMIFKLSRFEQLFSIQR